MKKEILLSLTIGMASCSKVEAENQISDLETAAEKQQGESRNFLRKSLPGPDSVIFRNQLGVCGEVNYIKKRDTYTGFKRFVMADRNIVLMEGFTDPENFKLAWKTMCKQR
jgi:hypothetical protein